MIAILERLLKREHEDQAAIVGTFGDLVKAVATGEIKTETRIVNALESCNKTPSDLATAVQQFEKRRALLAQLADADQVAARLREIESQLTTLNESERTHREQVGEKYSALMTARAELVVALLSAMRSAISCGASARTPRCLSVSVSVSVSVNDSTGKRRWWRSSAKPIARWSRPKRRGGLSSVSCARQSARGES